MTVFSATGSISQSEKAYSPAATFSILSWLRLETHAEHNALDQLLDLMNTKLTLQSYVRQLKQFYGFYAPLEQALQARRNLSADGLDGITLPDVLSEALLARLNKTSYLQQDLQYLGIPTDDQLLCCNLLPLRTQADVLGCLYVMEGATLGGRLISQHVQIVLGITPATGGSFFHGYGEHTGSMWQGMRQFLVAGSPDKATENAIVTNAIATFSRLRSWCETFPQKTKIADTHHA